MTNTLGIMLEILSNYLGIRLSVRIIGPIKRRFFHMVTHVFDNSNLSQEIFAIHTWRAVICFLGHGRKHMLTILSTIWRLGLSRYQFLMTELVCGMTTKVLLHFYVFERASMTLFNKALLSNQLHVRCYYRIGNFNCCSPGVITDLIFSGNEYVSDLLVRTA